MGSLGQLNEYVKAVSDAINSQNSEYADRCQVLYSSCAGHLVANILEHTQASTM
mgnify:CR=1 FL=1